MARVIDSLVSNVIDWDTGSFFEQQIRDFKKDFARRFTSYKAEEHYRAWGEVGEVEGTYDEVVSAAVDDLCAITYIFLALEGGTIDAWVDFNELDGVSLWTLQKYTGGDVHWGDTLTVGDGEVFCTAIVTAIHGEVIELAIDPTSFFERTLSDTAATDGLAED